MSFWRSPSIRGRLVQALLLWSVLWCVALGGAVWVVVQDEVEELLDDSLRSVAEGLIGPLAQNRTLIAEPDTRPSAQGGSGRFMWQLVSHQGTARVVAAARGAPTTPLHAAPTAGFSDILGWRVFGLASGSDGQMVYVAQTTAERYEAEFKIALAVMLAGVSVALLALVWLNGRIRHEMRPLHDLSQRLTYYNPLHAGATLGAAEREELQPVHAAIDALAARLARRIANERAFTAHAAHALRTPLAGIDAQLAVALREAAPSERARLQRVRVAAERLQRVVMALLAMFRTGAEVQRVKLDLAALTAKLPVEGLMIEVQATLPLTADADLVTAAVLNLLDNAQRHGAGSVTLSTPAVNVLRVHDDGPGVTAGQRCELQAAIDAQDYEGRTGLGLMLADLVARAHGGSLVLTEEVRGFAALMRLGPDPSSGFGLC